MVAGIFEHIMCCATTQIVGQNRRERRMPGKLWKTLEILENYKTSKTQKIVDAKKIVLTTRSHADSSVF